MTTLSRQSRSRASNFSSSGLRSRSRASPSTWSSGEDHPARDSGPSCVTTRLTLPPLWTCLLSRPLASICSMPSSSCGSIAETLDQRHSQPDRVGCTSDNRGLSLGWGSALHDPRPGSHLRYGRHTPTACHGHSGQAFAPASPWQNSFVERLIGSIRRECLDQRITSLFWARHICAGF